MYFEEPVNVKALDVLLNLVATRRVTFETHSFATHLAAIKMRLHRCSAGKGYITSAWRENPRCKELGIEGGRLIAGIAIHKKEDTPKELEHEAKAGVPLFLIGMPLATLPRELRDALRAGLHLLDADVVDSVGTYTRRIAGWENITVKGLERFRNPAERAKLFDQIARELQCPEESVKELFLTLFFGGDPASWEHIDALRKISAFEELVVDCAAEAHRVADTLAWRTPSRIDTIKTWRKDSPKFTLLSYTYNEHERKDMDRMIEASKGGGGVPVSPEWDGLVSEVVTGTSAELLAKLQAAVSGGVTLKSKLHPQTLEDAIAGLRRRYPEHDWN
jgi:hypothetical protein